MIVVDLIQDVECNLNHVFPLPKDISCRNGIDILHIQITLTQMVHALVWPEVYRFFLHIADELESFYNGRLRISLLGTHNRLNYAGLRHMSIVSECSVELIVAITEIAYSHVKPCLYLIRKRVHEEG